MSLWRIDGHREIEYQITIEADTEGRARALARQAIEEGTRPEGLVEYWDNDTGLDLWSRGMDRDGKWKREATE